MAVADRNRTPVLDPDGVPWYGGAWLGSLAGGTAWMLTAAASLARSPGIAAGCLAAFAAVNGLGWWAWRHRRRVRFFRAAQVLVLVSGGLGVTLAFLLGVGAGTTGAGFGRGDLVLVLWIPTLVIVFEVLSRRAGRQQTLG